MNDLFDKLLDDEIERDERGQILVLLALAMVGLLIAAGLATDAGVLFMRKSQFDRAVDAAALAGVTELPLYSVPSEKLNAANVRGQQLLAANDVLTDNPTECPTTVDATFWNTPLDAADPASTPDYCGRQGAGQMPGSLRYHVEVRWQAEVYFMGLLGFDTIPLYSRATAEYMPMVDMFASESSFNILQSNNEAIFGPASCSSFGDAYTPAQSPYWDELEGSYTYRIRVPQDYLDNHSSLRVEIFDPDTGSQATNTHTIYNQAGAELTGRTCSDTSQTQPCLLPYDQDLDGNTNDFWFVRTDENRGGDGTELGCTNSGSYSTFNNTRTMYRLYYLQQQADGSLQEVDLAYYIGKSDDPNEQSVGGTQVWPLSSATYSAAEAAAEAVNTDMMWVSPGAPSGERLPEFRYNQIFGSADTTLLSPAEPATAVENCETFRANNPGITSALTCSGDGNFIIDFNSETNGIYVQPSPPFVRDIFVEVRGLSGASENGFELWAGPPLSTGSNYSVPSEVNARHLYLLRQRDPAIGNNPDIYSPDGVGVYGIGHLPMNSNVNNRAEIPLAYLGPEFSGQNVTIELFDADSGADPPLVFYFDSIPQVLWTACFDDGTVTNNNCEEAGGQQEHLVEEYSGNIPNPSAWSTYTFTIPSEEPGDLNSVPFYGGRLYVSYNGGSHDTVSWKMTIESRPFLVR